MECKRSIAVVFRYLARGRIFGASQIQMLWVPVKFKGLKVSCMAAVLRGSSKKIEARESPLENGSSLGAHLSFIFPLNACHAVYL